MRSYVDDEVAAGRLPKGSLSILRVALLVGAFARGRVAELTGYRERRARQVLVILDKELLISQGPRAPVNLGSR